MKKKLVIVLSLLSVSGWAWAQNCPSGIPAAGNPQCLPPDALRSPYYQSSAASTQPRGPQWQLTWGAIASDNTTSDVGVAVGHFSRGKAKSEALYRCAEYGSKKCRVLLAYKNQCAVYVQASENGKAVGGVAYAQSGPSIDVASQLGLSACKATRGGGECTIVYSDCTVPELVD